VKKVGTVGRAFAESPPCSYKDLVKTDACFFFSKAKKKLVISLATGLIK
jgi:hypothetical protein